MQTKCMRCGSWLTKDVTVIYGVPVCLICYNDLKDKYEDYIAVLSGAETRFEKDGKEQNVLSLKRENDIYDLETRIKNTKLAHKSCKTDTIRSKNNEPA